jgi:hypothetical protein
MLSNRSRFQRRARIGPDSLHRAVLVTGSGSSGSNYVAELLRRNRIDVSHDTYLGRDGIVTNACDGTDVWVYAFGRGERRDYVLMKVPVTEFDRVVHLIRDPLKAIGSVLAKWQRFGRVWRHVAETVPGIAETDVTLAAAANYWLVWNGRLQEVATTRVRFEDVLADRQMLGTAVGRPLRRSLDPAVPVQPSGATVYPTWEQLNLLDGGLTTEIAALARVYGYDADLVLPQQMRPVTDQAAHD